MPSSHREDRDSRHRERERDEKGHGRSRHHDRERSSSPRKDKDREHRHSRKRRERTPESGNRRDDEEDDEPTLDLAAMGVKEIGEDDYFLRSSEFKFWLKEERGKYLDEMTSESAHKFFRKFVRRWNDGALPEKCYKTQPATALPSSSNTAYKWNFANNRSRVDKDLLAQARADVDRLTHSKSSIPESGPLPPSPSQSTTTSRPLGPSLPTASDRQYGYEKSRDELSLSRKAQTKAALARVEDIVPRSTGGGREAKIEERKATNAINREGRERDGAAGLEVDEGVLLGDSGGFAAAVAARNAAAARRNDRKAIATADRRAADEERLAERRSKEASTMDMFKAMAKERFG